MAQSSTIDLAQVRQKLNMPDLTDEAIRTVLASKGITTQAAADKWAKSQAPASAPSGLTAFLQQLPSAFLKAGRNPLPGDAIALKDVASYPGHALGAANQLVGDIPGANSLANWINSNVYGPLGTGESAVGKALGDAFIPGALDRSAQQGQKGPAKGDKKAAPATKEVTREISVPFDLSAAVQQAAAPYTQALEQAAGGGLPGGLNQYLAHVPAGIANTIRTGIGNEQQAEQGLVGALQAQQSQEGNAGLLADLLNSARYQTIYKQNLYAPPPPANTDLGQLFAKVAGNTGAIPGGVASNPFGLPGVTPSTGNAKGARNPYGTPPKV